MTDHQSVTVKKIRLIQKACLDPALSKADLLCLVYLLERYNRQTGDAWPSFNTMARDLSISARHIPRIIKSLQLGGYIQVKSGTRTKSNRYKPIFKIVNNWNPGWCDKVLTAKSVGVLTPESVGTDTEVSRGTDTEVSLTLLNRTILNEHTQEGQADTQNQAPPEGVCVQSFSFSEEKKDSVHSELTPEQAEYIKLEVWRAKRDCNIKTTPEAYTRYLKQQARNGELEIDQENLDWIRSDYESDLFAEYKNKLFNGWTPEQAAAEIKKELTTNPREWTVDYNGETLTVFPGVWRHYLQEKFPDIFARVEAEIQQEEGQQ